MKYIDAEKVIAEIDSILSACTKQTHTGVYNTCHRIKGIITSLQQEQPNNMIQWTGNNLKEVIDFTGKSPRFGEWFKSWEEFESYVHSHGDILKLFSDDGSHFEVPVGAWIVKTPDGYNVPSVARFIHVKQEHPQLPGIEDPGIPGKDFIPVEWVDTCEMYGKWKIVKQEQLEVDLEKFTEKIKTFQGRYKYPEILSIKGAMAFMARMFYQYPNIARQWYDSLPKTTMD